MSTLSIFSRCLVKSPEARAKASELLQHEFIKNSKPPEILADCIKEAQAMKDQLAMENENQCGMVSDESLGTMLPGDSGTLVNFDPDSDGGTMIQHATLTSDKPGGAQDLGNSLVDIESNLGTMVINEDDDDTMQSKCKKLRQKNNSALPD